MAIIDLWGKKLQKAVKAGEAEAVNGNAVNAWIVRFESLPKTLEEMQALPEASLDAPFKAAALTVAALCVWPEDKVQAKEMLKFLSGPKELSALDWQFISDRFMDGKDYIPRSYFIGATPENDYTPSKPYSIRIVDEPNALSGINYATVFLQSGGADSMRQVKLRYKPSTGQWFLWEQFLLAGIREPKSQNAWA